LTKLGFPLLHPAHCKASETHALPAVAANCRHHCSAFQHKFVQWQAVCISAASCIRPQLHKLGRGNPGLHAAARFDIRFKARLKHSRHSYDKIRGRRRTPAATSKTLPQCTRVCVCNLTRSHCSGGSFTRHPLRPASS